MVSTIRIGPEGGPYVKVEENNGTLDITTPNDTVDLQSNELVNAALGGIMNANGNDITNVNQLDANSVNTGRITIDGDSGQIYSDRTETSEISANSSAEITLSGLIPPTVLFAGFLTVSISIQNQANSVAYRSWQVIFRTGDAQSDPVAPTLQNNISATLDTVTMNTDGDLTIGVSNNASFPRTYNIQVAAYGVSTQ